MQPFFLDGSSGRLFAVYTAAAAGQRHRMDVLFVPPFAEEMNRARRMATALARRLSASGCGTLRLDLYGTGDSEGDFAAARPDIWLDDLRCALAWLAARGAPALAMVGLRLGAVLALMGAARLPPRLSHLVLWQPVHSGEQMLTQFLRVLAMAGRVTTADLRARLERGETLEVAGYSLSPALAAALDGLRLDALPVPAGVALRWLDVMSQPDRPWPPESARQRDHWRQTHPDFDAQRVVGEPFWGLMEPPLVEGLLDQTVAWLGAAPT